MEWTKGRKVMAVIGGIAILFMIYGIVHFIIMNNQYNKVIEVIKQGDYTRAEEMLIDMNVIGTKNDEKMADFRFRSVVSCEHLEIENAEHYFVDSAVLYVYISAMEYYNDNKFDPVAYEDVKQKHEETGQHIDVLKKSYLIYQRNYRVVDIWVFWKTILVVHT